MDSEKLINAIQNEFSKNQDLFFKYAWREKINDVVNIENKYLALIRWMDEQIESNKIIINAFNPADKNEFYKNGFFNLYRKACEEIAILLNFKIIILDDRCTNSMRKNVEYAVRKIFKTHYNELLNKYV